MIKIAVQTGGAEEYLGIDGAYRLIKECGFDAVDANIDHVASGQQILRKEIPQYLLGNSFDLEIFKPWKDAAQKYRLENYQAHAPIPSCLYHDPCSEYNDTIIEMLKNTIRGCDYIDCRNLVIHPFYLDYEHQTDPEAEKARNIERYASLIPVAKEYGVTICLENVLFDHRGKIYSATCSDIDTACDYVDTLNAIAGETRFGFCLDTGHQLLIGGDIKQAMIKLADRLCAFHIHDNNGANDLHLAPYMGVQDWDRFIEGLRACGYDKTISFETFHIWNVVDKELCPSMMRFIAETGRMFARRAQQI